MNISVNKIYCSEASVFMKKLPDELVDLTVTSPPYDNLRDYKGYNFQFEDIAHQLFRITKPGGVIVWVVNDQTKKGSESLTSFKQAIYFVEVCGFNLETMIYAKQNPMPQQIIHKRYAQAFEYMFVFSKGLPVKFNPIIEPCKYAGSTNNVGFRQKDGSISRKKINRIQEEKIKSNIWFYRVGYMHTSKDKIAFEHPAIFPEDLARDHILSWTNQGDLVFDPMSGSGTTLKQAKLLNRNFLGCDISSQYCRIARRRLNAV
jgi:site-specific DNA-methyltransferase (adenine-specific)